MSLAIAQPFASNADLNLCPYPVDLSTIKARLDNRFYRRTSAVEFDVRYIFTNALKFLRAKSDVVRSALIVRDMCLKIIRNHNAVVVVNINQQLPAKLREGGTDSGGPSTSRAEATPNTSSASQHSESEEDSPKSSKSINGVNISKSKVICSNLCLCKFCFHVLNYFRKRNFEFRKISTGRHNVRFYWIFWISRKIRFHSANLSAFWMYLTTRITLSFQWTCKLLVNDWKSAITQHRPISPKMSVSSLTTRRATTTPTEIRGFSQWPVDSRSCSKNIFNTFWFMKFRKPQLDVILNKFKKYFLPLS